MTKTSAGRSFWIFVLVALAIPALVVAWMLREADDDPRQATVEWNARLVRGQGILPAGAPCPIVGRFSSNGRDVTGCLTIACEGHVLYDDCAGATVDLTEQSANGQLSYRLRYSSPLRPRSGPHVVVVTPERRGFVDFGGVAGRPEKYEFDVQEVSLPRRGIPLLSADGTRH